MLRLNDDDDDKGLNIDQLLTMFGLTLNYDIRFSYVYHVKVIGSLLLICFKFLIRSDAIISNFWEVTQNYVGSRATQAGNMKLIPS